MRGRLRFNRTDLLLLLSNGLSFRRTLFVLACLITLVGSSFRPAPGPSWALGSIGPLGTEDSALLGGEAGDDGLFYSVHQVAKGETVSGIAERYDVSIDTIFSANGITSARSLRPGQLLKVPNQSGIFYTAKSGDTVEGIASQYSISADRLIEANGLLAREFSERRTIFLPDAKLPAAVSREIAGDLFKWPVRGIITSWYSWRRDPFSGRNSFHNGIDIGVPMRTPVGAAMEGRVVEAGYSSIMGKYVTLSHSGGWKTLYAHMDSISVQNGQYLGRGQRLGYSGNTGYSTGPHLHFTVWKNGKMVNPANVLQ
ncbi:MAG TPA: M23 family metallopeptidase [Rectinemataceae bacterium]